MSVSVFVGVGGSFLVLRESVERRFRVSSYTSDTLCLEPYLVEISGKHPVHTGNNDSRF